MATRRTRTYVGEVVFRVRVKAQTRSQAETKLEEMAFNIAKRRRNWKVHYVDVS